MAAYRRPEVRAIVETRGKAFGVATHIGDSGISGTWRVPIRRRALPRAFALFAWRPRSCFRAKNPPAWELAIAQTWPSLAQDWGLAFDLRRAKAQATLRS